jgi:hypothetical protein
VGQVVKKNTRRTRKTTNRFAYILLHLSRKDVQIFLICVGGATLLWFVNALTKDRSEVISYPIEFIYDRKQYVEVKPLPSTIRIAIKGTGWQILRKILRIRVKPVQYVLENPAQPIKRYILASQLRRNVTESLKEVRLEDILNDTIPIVMDKKASRVIEIELDSINIPLAKGYRINNSITINPKKITFTGPEKMVRALPSPFYLGVEGLVIDDNFEKMIRINIPSDTHKLIQKNTNEVLVKFDIEAFSQQKYTTIVQLKNFPATSKFFLKNEHRLLEVNYSFAKENTSKIRLQDFKIMADFDTFNPRDSSVALTLAGKPQLIAERDIKFKRRIKLDYAP